MAKTNRKTSAKVVKRGKKRGRVENLTPFTSENQPSPEAKSRGWAKKRAKDAIVQAFDDFALLSYAELREMAANINRNIYQWPDGKELTVTEVKALKYLLNNKLDMDFMNRGLSYARQEIDLTTKGKPIVNPLLGGKTRKE